MTASHTFEVSEDGVKWIRYPYTFQTTTEMFIHLTTSLKVNPKFMARRLEVNEPASMTTFMMGPYVPPAR